MNDLAVVLLDYQVALCEEGPHCRQPALAALVKEREVLAHARDVLRAARATSTPVVHVRLAFDPSYELRTIVHPALACTSRSAPCWSDRPRRAS